MNSRRLLAAIAPLLLAGCLTNGPTTNTPDPAAMTTDDVKNYLLRERHTFFKDPESIRGTKLGFAYSCPRHGGIGSGGTTCICIEYNGKNSFGGYTGTQQQRLTFRGTTLDHAVRPDLDDTAHCASLIGFPELNGDFSPPKSEQAKKPKRT